MKASALVLAVITAAALLVTGGSVSAQEVPPSDTGSQPSVVEDYSYPGAEKIFTDTAVRLIAGDGHMLFVDCDKPRSGDIGLLRIRSSSLPNDGHSGLGVGIDRDGRVCFEITGRTGYVTMTLPAVYEIRGNGYAPGAGHSVTAELTTDSGVRSVVDIQKDKATQVGTGSSSAETTLLKLVAKP